MPDQPTISHESLVQRADAWLKRMGCKITLLEYPAATRYGEIPDAIGWRGAGREQVSILLECKVSRGDFLADREKEFRQHPEYGMGNWRFFLCPPDLINRDELPRGWGLLYVFPTHIRHVAGMQWTVSSWTDSPFVACKDAEASMLVSALRRVQLRGHFGDVYDPIESATPSNDGTDPGATESFGSVCHPTPGIAAP